MKHPPAFWIMAPHAHKSQIFASEEQSTGDDNGGFEVWGQYDRFITEKAAFVKAAFDSSWQHVMNNTCRVEWENRSGGCGDGRAENDRDLLGQLQG